MKRARLLSDKKKKRFMIKDYLFNYILRDSCINLNRVIVKCLGPAFFFCLWLKRFIIWIIALFPFGIIPFNIFITPP